MPFVTRSDNPYRQCAITGALSIWEVSEIWQALAPLLRTTGPLHIDLSAVEACDAAGLQIISRIQRQTHRGAADVRFTGLSSALLQAMQSAGMDPPALTRQGRSA